MGYLQYILVCGESAQDKWINPGKESLAKNPPCYISQGEIQSLRTPPPDPAKISVQREMIKDEPFNFVGMHLPGIFGSKKIHLRESRKLEIKQNEMVKEEGVRNEEDFINKNIYFLKGTGARDQNDLKVVW